MTKKKTLSKKAKAPPKAAKKKKAARKTREYDNRARSEKSNTNREKIVELYVNLLVEGNGQDVPLQVLAKKSKTSMRTLFRFFGDKESLNQEIGSYLGRFMPSVQESLVKMSFEEYAEYSYRVFDEYEKLFKAYIYTSFGQKSRALFRKTFVDLLVRKVQAELGGPLSEGQKRKVYLLVSLINANIWKDLKDSFGVNGEEISSTIRWAVRVLLDDLRRDVRSQNQ